MTGTSSFTAKSSSTWWRYLRVCGAILLPAIIIYALLFPASFARPKTPLLPDKAKLEQLCPQATSLYPTANIAMYRRLADVYRSEEFRSRVVDWVSVHIALWIVSLRIVC